MRPRSDVTVIALAALALTGCVTLQDAAPAIPTPPALLPDLSDVPEPVFDLGRTRAWWEDFVNSYPYRTSQSPTNVEAAEQIMSDLEAAGYEAKMFYYIPPEFRSVPMPVSGESPTEQGIRTVVGIKKGMENPEHVISWVAHYDSNAATIYAAYDDGSGTAVAMELARALAEAPTNKTLMPIFFDAEEVGLVASAAFVEQAMQSQEYVFDLVIGHDMTGINCPGHEWKMYQFVGENYVADVKPIEEALYNDTRLFTTEERDCVAILDVADRNSDERRFKEAGVPVIRMAGGRKATDYPAYHKPNDTVEFLYEFVGGPENYEKGLDLTLRASYWNVMVFDRLPTFTLPGPLGPGNE